MCLHVYHSLDICVYGVNAHFSDAQHSDDILRNQNTCDALQLCAFSECLHAGKTSCSGNSSYAQPPRAWASGRCSKSCARPINDGHTHRATANRVCVQASNRACTRSALLIPEYAASAFLLKSNLFCSGGSDTWIHFVVGVVPRLLADFVPLLLADFAAILVIDLVASLVIDLVPYIVAGFVPRPSVDFVPRPSVDLVPCLAVVAEPSVAVYVPC
ncbi:hypothetical protein GGI35DRAFT_64193 [Trichoderma velutinum]